MTTPLWHHWEAPGKVGLYCGVWEPLWQQQRVLIEETLLRQMDETLAQNGLRRVGDAHIVPKDGVLDERFGVGLDWISVCLYARADKSSS